MRISSLILAAVLLAGCAPIAPGANPVVVNSERTLQASFDTIDAFLKFDDAHRATMKAQYPAIHATAEQLRKDYPPLEREAVSVLRSYQVLTEPNTGSTLNGIITKVEALAATARQSLVTVQSVK